MLADLPPSSMVVFFSVSAELRTMPLPTAGAGEGDLVYGRVFDQLIADSAARARDEIEHTVRKPCLFHDLGDPNRRQGREGCRLVDHAVSGGEGWGDLRRGQQQREVEWGDCGHHTQRFALGVIQTRYWKRMSGW